MTEPVKPHPDIKRLVRIERTVNFAIEVDATSYINDDNTQMSDEEITAYEVMKVKDWAACITDVYESGPYAEDNAKSCISKVTFIETVVLAGDGDDSVGQAPA